ncbi:hypothetical protein [Deinococcus pimensis]|uniref:hypothetical protein n=1 Tax=Deinococcus pimensis TaxID=309888 RepID=UPI0004B33386|nr:hypothetical protein [Deinococcus pimensis]
MRVFLIGGGWTERAWPHTLGGFVAAATRPTGRRIAVVIVDEPDLDLDVTFSRYARVFEALGVHGRDLHRVVVSAERPLARGQLRDSGCTGVFVCGGLTPLFERSLCADLAWLDDLDADVPYAGFSAGAAIAARTAIVGGWRLRTGGREVDVTSESASEDLDLLDLRAGLGLVTFTVDVHATQWGTLPRLVHAVNADLTRGGWAIDEDTALHVVDGFVTVRGLGCAYHVRRDGEDVRVTVHAALREEMGSGANPDVRPVG